LEVETGASIVRSPTATTTYYVRINNPAPCGDVSATVQSATVTVNDPSTAPTSATADIPTICNGDLTDVTITANGGVLGTDAIYEWSELADFSALEVETGASIVRSPT